MAGFFGQVACISLIASFTKRLMIERLYSNLCYEFGRALTKDKARLAAKGLAALIDGFMAT